MKYLAACVAVLFTASQLAAQTQTPPAAPTTDTKPADVKPADKPADKIPDAKAPDAKPADPKDAPATKPPVKKEVKKPEEPKIPGQTIVRANGTFLGLEVVDGKFKLSFYDKKKKLMEPDITRATVRWPNVRSSTGDNHTVLNQSGKALVGVKTVLPPFTWNVYITFLQGDGENAKAVENFVVPFHG